MVKAFVCSFALVGMFGCVGPTGPGRMTRVSPAVRWTHVPGRQVGTSTFLFLPMSLPNVIDKVSVVGNYLNIVERAGAGPEIGWYKQKHEYSVSLEDGSVHAVRPKAGAVSAKDIAMEFADDWGYENAQRCKLPNGIHVLVMEIPPYVVYVGSDAEHLVTLFESEEVVRGIWYVGMPDGNAILGFSQVLLCVDLSRLAKAIEEVR